MEVWIITFGQQGIVTTDFAGGEDDAMAIAAQADGRLLVAGQVREPVTGGDIGIARYTTAGALDTGFGVGGLVSIDVDGDGDVARAIKLQSDGRILLAGDSRYPSLGYSQNMTVVRLMADGSALYELWTMALPMLPLAMMTKATLWPCSPMARFWSVVSAMGIS